MKYRSTVFFAVSALFCVYIYGDTAQTHSDSDLSEWTQAFAKSAHILNHSYYDNVDIKRAMKRAINALVSIDSHSSLLDEDSLEEVQEQITGNFCGIGIAIPGSKNDSDEAIAVLDVLSHGPAMKADIKPGDKIVHIDNSTLRGMTIEEVSKALRGPRGSMVKLSIMRPQHATPIHMVITRDEVKEETVKSYFFSEFNTWYTSLSVFSQETAHQLESVLHKAQNHNARGLILDLRNNAGGLFDAAIDVAQLFLPRNSLVVSVKNKKRNETDEWRTKEKPLLTNGIPVIILVNNYTASCAEILAGSLQAYAQKKLPYQYRVIVVGTQTFGKGSVQDVIPLTHNTALKITSGLYYLPNGKTIQAVGAQPDIELEQRFPPSNEMKWLCDTFGHEATLKKSIKNEQAKPHTQNTNVTAFKHKQFEKIAKDYQIQTAITMLTMLAMAPEKQVATSTDCITYIKAHQPTENIKIQEVAQ